MQTNQNTEKINFKIVQLKFLAMHITNQKFTGNLQNIFMEHDLYLISCQQSADYSKGLYYQVLHALLISWRNPMTTVKAQLTTRERPCDSMERQLTGGKTPTGLSWTSYP